MSDFITITSNDNWFKQHPEKIAGVEFETTSFYFPIQVKGTKDDVLRVTGTLNENKTIEIFKSGKTKTIFNVKEEDIQDEIEETKYLINQTKKNLERANDYWENVIIPKYGNLEYNKLYSEAYKSSQDRTQLIKSLESQNAFLKYLEKRILDESLKNKNLKLAQAKMKMAAAKLKLLQ